MPSYRPDRYVLGVRRRQLGYNPIVPPNPGGEITHPFSAMTPSSFKWVATTGNNANPGTEAQPYQTIQHAINQAVSGTQINVKAGTYNELIVTSKHGSPSAPIWLMSIDGHSAAIINPPNNTADPMRFGSAENWVIEGFKINGSVGRNNFRAANGVSDPSRYLVLRYLECVGVSGSEDGIKLGSSADHIYVHYCTVHEGGDGTEQAIDTVATNDIEIRFCEVYNYNGSSAIQFKGGSTNCLITDNHVHDCPGDGIHIGGDTEDEFFVSGFDTYEAKNTTCTNNQINDLGGRGMWCMGAHDTLIEGNNIFNCGNDDIELLASASPTIFNCQNTTIRNNTFDNTNWLTVGSGQGTGLSVTGNSPNNDS